MFTRKKGFFVTHYQGRECCIGYAKAPGFETYTTGWYSLIIQPIELTRRLRSSRESHIASAAASASSISCITSRRSPRCST